MENALLIALSKQMVMRRNMDIVANNLANMNTTAYKGETVLFEEFIMPVAQANGPEKELAFVQDYGVVRNLSEGRFDATTNPLDVAIAGDGYFVVNTPGGDRYTRNGHFKLDGDGQIVTSQGHPVLGKDDRPIVLSPGESDITIANDGTITTNLGERGGIKMVRFENEQAMQKTGNNYYKTDERPLDAPEARTIQGMVEQSNVEPILEMTNMIQLLRQYQSTTKLMETGEDMKRRAVRELGKMPTG